VLNRFAGKRIPGPPLQSDSITKVTELLSNFCSSLRDSTSTVHSPVPLKSLSFLKNESLKHCFWIFVYRKDHGTGRELLFYSQVLKRVFFIEQISVRRAAARGDEIATAHTGQLLTLRPN